MKTISTALLCSFSLVCFAGDWPQWFGPTRNGHAATDEPFSPAQKDFKVVWKKPIGTGFSSPVVLKGKLAYLDDTDDREVLHLVHADSGKEIWSADLDQAFKDEWGSGPRSTPFFDGDRIYAQSCRGEVRCFQVADGKVLWKRNFEQDLGVKFLGSQAREGTAQRRGNNGSGILDGNMVIVPVGNTNGACLAAFDKMTGKILWKSGNDETAYSSLAVAAPGGIRQVIALTADALAGFEKETGKQLWRVPLKTNAKRHAATPLIIDDRVLVTSHTIGLVCYKITSADNQLHPTKLWENRDLKINLATPVIVGGHLYSHGQQKNFVCADLATGKTVWNEPGGGEQYSAVTYVNGALVALADDGRMVAFKPANQFSKIAEWQVCGKNWNFPAFAGGKVFVRDSRNLQCLDFN